MQFYTTAGHALNEIDDVVDRIAEVTNCII
jgi:hypothetical protein